MQEIEASNAAVYCWSGYSDGVYTRAAIKRYLALKNPGTKLVLGPWYHGNVHMIDPNEVKPKVHFGDIGEIIRFFDHHLKGDQNGIESETPIHYYTMGEGRWKTAKVWLPPGFKGTSYYYGPDHTLIVDKVPEENGSDPYQVDFTTSTGAASRWVALVNVTGKKIGYPNRHEEDKKLLVYQTPVLPNDVEVAGHPWITIYVITSDPDPQFFVYLEDVPPDGSVRYVTEGQFRGINRALRITGSVNTLPFSEQTLPSKGCNAAYSRRGRRNSI
jgi:putative CocE/NonD family hydrolase